MSYLFNHTRKGEIVNNCMLILLKDVLLFNAYMLILFSHSLQLIAKVYIHLG